MEWLSVQEYAKRRGISKQLVQYRIKTGKLKTRRAVREKEITEVLDELPD